MSDISLNFTWLDLLLISPAVGWPGILGAVAGNFLVFWFRLSAL